MVELKVRLGTDLVSILIGIPFLLFIPSSWGEVAGPEADPTGRSCTVGKSWGDSPAGESIGARIGTRTWGAFSLGVFTLSLHSVC